MEKIETIETGKREIMKLVDDFGIVHRNQIMEYVNDSDIAGHSISALKKEGRLHTIPDTDYLTSDEGLIGKERKYDRFISALWVYLDFRREMKAGFYAISPDSDIPLTFECNGELYDVIYVRFRTEDDICMRLHMKERYLPPEDVNVLKRIILIDIEKQKADINILGTYAYAICDEDGNVKYIK